MSIEINFSGLLVYLLVFARIAGMILLNPLFARNNIPQMARMGLVIGLTLLIAPMQPMDAVLAMGDLEYAFSLLRELFVGAIYGYVFIIFYYLLFYAGDIMDTDIGLAMAKSFDPATQIQVSFSGQLVTMFFVMYLFASGTHLALIRMYADSFSYIPLGASTLSLSISAFIMELFVSVFMLAIRLVAPLMVAEFILQASMGILMKFIPQITVFVINFQLRILLGVLLLFLLAPYIGQFIDNYLTVMMDNLLGTTEVMSGGMDTT
ncbi:flagellar biosynthetic protein FliR [Ruminococcaceae bacterium OttesenSCG-928-I18]|nr:flagellar biosynthetic protein FliR [Ruminococcaceae bacterium OttesenSCG-928-I18]